MDLLPHIWIAVLGGLGLAAGYGLTPLANQYGARWSWKLMTPLMMGLGIAIGFVGGTHPATPALGMAALVLMAAGAIDLQTKKLPNLLVLVLAIIAALTSGFSLIIPWETGLIGAGFGLGLLVLVDLIYRLRGKGRGVGMGDLKLVIGIGGLVGPYYMVWVLLGASVLQTIVGLIALTRGKKLNDLLPFGPALAFVTILVLFYMLNLATGPA